MFVLSKSLQSLCAAIVLLVSIACTGQAAAQAWTQLAPTGTPPSARGSHTAGYDPVSNRMVVFAGYDGSPLNDVWVLSNANGLGGTSVWAQLAPTGTPPSARIWPTAVYDPANNRMTVFGGYNGGLLNDVWVLSNANGLGGTPAWSQLTPIGTPPGVREVHTAVYDVVNNRMIVFGGFDNIFPALGAQNDVWVLSNANGLGGTPVWTQLLPAGTPPSARYWHTAVYDPASNRMVVFGGYDSSFNLSDTWVLNNANGLGGTPAWTQLAPTGTPPSARQLHTAVYDPATNRMVVFAGYGGSLLNDVWLLSNANGLGGAPAWTQLSPTGTLPAAREEHTAVYDPANNRMMVFGGYNGNYQNDVWVLSSASGIINLPVGIDIKAGVSPNTITLANDRDITVAILSTSTFKAPTAVDRTSLTFGHTGTEASLTSCNTASRDVNGDGRMDLVCHFSVTAASFQLGDTVGYLKGMTLVGNTIHGTDSVIVK